MFILLAVAMTLPDAWLNQPYVPQAKWERVSTRCAMPIPTTRVVAGVPPPGLQTSVRGDMEGIPTEPGVFTFTVEVSDGCSRRMEQRQIRVMPAPILTAEAETLEFQCLQGAPSLSGGIVRVSGSAPGRAYSVDIAYNEDKPEVRWLQAAMRDGVLPTEGSALEADTLRLSINPGKLPAGSYTARLRVSTWQGANTPELLFRLRVDTPQAVLAPALAAPVPIPIVLRIAEAPSIQVIRPPLVPYADPPYFLKYQPKPLYPPPGMGTRGTGRSRVLPFPRILLPPKPAAKSEAKPTAPAPDKPAAKPVQKHEAPPERTKPSALAPPPTTAKSEKPKAAH
ncbi:MAG: hypothetical protein ACKV2U_11945 [Bryobacteraceae bacterium]